MKRFMRGGKESNASREQGGGCSSVLSPLPTAQVDEDLASKASPTMATNAATTTAKPSLVAKQEVATVEAAKKEAAAKVAAANTTTSKVIEAKQVLAKQAAAKQATAKQAAAKQLAARNAAACEEESTRLEELTAKQATTTQEEATRLQAFEAKQAAATQEKSATATQKESLGANVARKELIPNVFWFSKPAVAAGVADSFKAHYNFPYMNWTEVPENRLFTWKPEYDDMVRRDYEKKALQRLKDHVNKAAKVPLHKRISWMSESVRREFIRKREHPDFIKRSVKAKKNRYSNQSETSFDPGHRQGSISTIEVAERLAVEKNGVPLAVDVYEKTHGLEMPDGEKKLIGDRSNKTMAEYKEKLAQYSDKGITKAPDEVYLEVVGGKKKGKVYGLGNASSMF